MGGFTTWSCFGFRADTVSRRLSVFEDCTRFEARVRAVVFGMQRSLLGYYVDCTGSGDELKPVIIAGGQLGYDRQATRGGGESGSGHAQRKDNFDTRHISPVSFVNLHDLVATLNDNIGRYTSMTSLFINLTRLILEDAAALSDAELDEVSCYQDDPIDEETKLGWLL